MTAPTVYLISGANRGIGLGLVQQLALRDNTVVFAGARKPAEATHLHELEKQFQGKVHVVELVSADDAGNAGAIEKIKTVAGRLDVVIANAGISKSKNPALTTSPESIREHFEINAIGPLVLFQATYPLLSASTPAPKFVVITSIAGSLTIAPTLGLPILPYGVSKAAVNWLSRSLHFEHPNLVCFALIPGEVNTDMTMAALDNGGQFAEYVKSGLLVLKSPEEASAGILKTIDASSRESMGGAYVKWDPEGGRSDW